MGQGAWRQAEPAAASQFWLLTLIRNKQTLAIVALTGLLLAAAYVLLALSQGLRRRLRDRLEHPKASPKDVRRHIQNLADKTPALRLQHGTAKEPRAFGVFLGDFAQPPAESEAHLLSKWDVIVLDPLRSGVLDAASQSTSSQVLARLDADALLASSDFANQKDDIRSFSVVAQALTSHLKFHDERWSPFTGVLLANWQTRVKPIVFNQLLGYLHGCNLDVYLEVSPPAFLSASECSEIDMQPLRGIICRNGTISTDGDRCNYYQMEGMRRVQRALGKHASMGGHTFLMWETIDDAAELTHAVVKRSYNWCRFNSTISWIGPSAALTNADVAASQTVPGEPLGSLMWLKSNEMIAAQEIWRKNDEVCVAAGWCA